MQSKWQDVTDDATIHHDSWSCFEKTSKKIQRFQFGNTFYSCDLVKVKYMRSYTAFEKEVQTLTLRLKRVYSKFHKHVIHAVIERLRPWKKHTINVNVWSFTTTLSSVALPTKIVSHIRPIVTTTWIVLGKGRSWTITGNATNVFVFVVAGAAAAAAGVQCCAIAISYIKMISSSLDSTG